MLGLVGPSLNGAASFTQSIHLRLCHRGIPRSNRRAGEPYGFRTKGGRQPLCGGTRGVLGTMTMRVLNASVLTLPQVQGAGGTNGPGKHFISGVSERV